MTEFNSGDRVTFAGGKGEIIKTNEHPNGSQLRHVCTDEGQLRKLPSSLPHIEKLDGIVDRLAAARSTIRYITTSASGRPTSTVFPRP
jgi:hypothetical protein